jgi:hypothetical protein
MPYMTIKIEFVSTSNNFLGLKGLSRVRGSDNGVLLYQDKEVLVWTRNYEGVLQAPSILKALPVAERSSTTRYAIWSGSAEFKLIREGSPYRTAIWEVSEEPITYLEGYYDEMRDPQKVANYVKNLPWLDV